MRFACFSEALWETTENVAGVCRGVEGCRGVDKGSVGVWAGCAKT